MGDRSPTSNAPADERVRLFVALELPDDVVTAFVVWREAALEGEAGLRSVPPPSLHVTLCFLGWRYDRELADIVGACETVRPLPRATLRAGHAIWLPPRRPRVLALELDDERDRLAHVQAALSDTLHRGGWYVPEARPFLAHVTLARVARGARVRPRDLAAPAPTPFPGSRVTLFRSRLARSGARYERLASIELSG